MAGVSVCDPSQTCYTDLVRDVLGSGFTPYKLNLSRSVGL